jgi:signal transduction histidine kinase
VKIRHKLFFGFGLYIFLAVVAGALSYKELRTITTRLTLVEVADDATNSILEVRRFEKNFLLYKDGTSLEELKKHLGTFKEHIANITTEIIRQIGTDNYTMMKNAITEYEFLIERISLNFKSQEEIVARLRDKGRDIEKKLKGNDLRIFLILRRFEKNLLLYKDQTTYGTFMKTFSSLAADGEADEYRVLVERVFELFRDERYSVEKMRLRAREIQSFTEELSKRERSRINDILEMSRNMLLIALLVILAVGIVINVKLARSIATPIRKLEKVTKKVAMGDFSEVIEVKGADELTSLEISFNQMEDRMKDTMNSLEQAVKNLHEKQAQLVEAEKLASIGILAAGIAHEINNPLTSVLTFSHLMLEQMSEDDPRRETLKMMVRETERARIIVRQLLSFAKETKLKKVKTNINCPINEMIETLSAQGLFNGIEVDLNLSEGLPEISADPIKIEQVVLNVLLNAIHSITPPGKIGITTHAAGDFIKIIISDTGCGIPEEYVGKIFDPFYTTKDSTKGTGLGLAVSYGIIKKHGGDIEVKSTVGKGSTFIVRLPING